MKKFSFRLDTLLELRKQREEGVKLRLAEKNREIIEKKHEFTEVCEKLKELQTGEKARRSGRPAVLLLRYGVAFRHKLKNDILQIGRSIEKLQAEAAVIQKELVAARKARRALEIIRDNRRNAWTKEYHRREQLFIDDIAQQKYIASRKT